MGRGNRERAQLGGGAAGGDGRPLHSDHWPGAFCDLSSSCEEEGENSTYLYKSSVLLSNLSTDPRQQRTTAFPPQKSDFENFIFKIHTYFKFPSIMYLFILVFLHVSNYLLSGSNFTPGGCTTS